MAAGAQGALDFKQVGDESDAYSGRIMCAIIPLRSEPRRSCPIRSSVIRAS